MFDALRSFLEDVPIWIRLLERAMSVQKAASGHAEDVRSQIERLNRGLTAHLRSERRLYATVYYPDHEVNCTVCGATVAGQYWELNNPVTLKTVCVPTLLHHTFVAHAQACVYEPLQNISGTRMGATYQVLDIVAILDVMQDAAVPGEVIKDAQAVGLWLPEHLSAHGAQTPTPLSMANQGEP